MAVQRVVGPTPSGGTRAVLVFRDEKGRPVEKNVASHVEVQEQDDDGNVIASHTVTLEDGSVDHHPPGVGPQEGDDDDPAEKARHIAEIMESVLDDESFERMANAPDEEF